MFRRAECLCADTCCSVAASADGCAAGAAAPAVCCEWSVVVCDVAAKLASPMDSAAANGMDVFMV